MLLQHDSFGPHLKLCDLLLALSLSLSLCLSLDNKYINQTAECIDVYCHNSSLCFYPPSHVSFLLTEDEHAGCHTALSLSSCYMQLHSLRLVITGVTLCFSQPLQYWENQFLEPLYVKLQMTKRPQSIISDVRRSRRGENNEVVLCSDKVCVCVCVCVFVRV